MPIEDSIVLITSVDTENRKFGTGFVFHVDGEVDYVMTCRHVAADVAAEAQGAVCINYHEYPLLEIFMNTADDPDDMAVLKIRGPLEMAPLPIRPAGRPGLKIRAFGYYRYSSTPDNHRQLPVDGELGERGILNFRSRKGRLVTWDIEIEGRRTLHDGYSGSPVIYEGHVIGIVSHKLQKGEVGVAVSIDALGQLLPDIAVRLLKKEDTGVFEDFRETNVEISKNKVFICYAREDEDSARRLYNDLKKAGMEPWMDKQDLIPGQNWKFILNQAIQGSDYFIALLSPHSVSKRGYVQKEFNYALDVLDGMPPDEIFVIPVRLEDCEVPYEKVKDIQWVDLFVDYEGGLKSILRAFGQTAGAEIVEKIVVDTPTRESEEPLPGPSTVIVNDAGQGKILSIDNLGMEFVCIPAGEFMMGQNEQEKEELIKQVGLDKYKRYYQDELPRHRVTIEKAFYMKATMVTQGQWKAVMSGNPSHFKNCGDDCPVESVSWEDAQAFIRKLNEMEGIGGYRLPSEAEWEYAARAGTDTALYNGPIKIIGANNAPALDEIAWYGGNSGVEYDGGYDCSGWPDKQYVSQRCGPKPVKGKKPNSWGLYDMIGNVWEWCEDDWHDSYEGAPSDGSVWVDGPKRGGLRVVRGGSWGHDAGNCRSAYRTGGPPGARYGVLGFRLSRSYP